MASARSAFDLSKTPAIMAAGVLVYSAGYAMVYILDRLSDLHAHLKY